MENFNFTAVTRLDGTLGYAAIIVLGEKARTYDTFEVIPRNDIKNRIEIGRANISVTPKFFGLKVEITAEGDLPSYHTGQFRINSPARETSYIETPYGIAIYTPQYEIRMYNYGELQNTPHLV